MDKLINCWRAWGYDSEYYVTRLGSQIVQTDGTSRLMNDEKEIVTALRPMLTKEEWLQLPVLLAQRHRSQRLALDRKRTAARDDSRQRTEARRPGQRKDEALATQRAAADRLIGRVEQNHTQRQAQPPYERRDHERRQFEVAQWETRRQLEAIRWQAWRTEAEELAKRRADEQRKLEAEQRQAEEVRRVRRNSLLRRIEDVFESDFLSADTAFRDDSDNGLVTHAEYERFKIGFVQRWAERELQSQLDTEQAAAVAAVDGDIQVVARAGSGKTLTLVTRAIFLQKHCKVSPRELLLLAFNRKAVEEMKTRLAEVLGDDLPHVMTFHALAYALVQPDEELIFDDASIDETQLSRELQDVIDAHLRSEDYSGLIRDLMLAYFREDWERIVDGRFHLTMDELLAHRRALPRVSLKGHLVKSFGEKIIANVLFEHSIDYHYERDFRWDDTNYRPDFMIPTGPRTGIIVEYFGLKGDADYDEMSQRKREFWSGHEGWTLLEFSPDDLLRHGLEQFVQLLLQQLKASGVSWRRLSDEEIWELIRRRAVDSFTMAMKKFVNRCRKLNITPDELEWMVTAHVSALESEEFFLNVGVSIYRGYLAQLKLNNKEDFDGLMWRAVSSIREGQTGFVRNRGKERGDVGQLRFVMIDEFQDFSQMFYDLIGTIRTINRSVQFFGVGDDWQAINGFAGSDLRFFDDFATYFRDTSRRDIATNYRSPRLVVEVSNALMAGRGLPARASRTDAGLVWLCNLDEFEPSAAEDGRHDGDNITPAVLRLVRHFLDRGQDVVMLSRRNSVPWPFGYTSAIPRAGDELARFLEHVRSYLPEEDRGHVRISTTHGYKGREDSAVIVLDAIQRSYPLIHPHWIFLRIFGDTIARIEEEERRLFYVALTRAKGSLALLSEARRQSPYLIDIGRSTHLTSLRWTDLHPVPSLDGARLQIRVFNAFHVKDGLKDSGYRWDAKGKYWHRSVMAEGFSFQVLRKQPWAQDVGIKVYSESGQLLYRQ